MADLSSVLGAAGLGGAIGQAVVRLELDTSKYLGEMNAAKAETTASTNTMATATSKFGGVAKIAFAVAAIAAVKFVSDSVKAYQEHEEALLKLQTTINNSPKLVGASTQAFEEQATALQNLTGFQDEEILKADAVIGRFDLTAEQLQKINPLILDYARATGQDAATAAGAIGKALLGNTRALKALGIEFTATGKRGQDFNTIVADLEGKVGGLAEAYGKTLPGQLAIAAAKFDDVKETVGKAVIPILSDLLDLVKPLIGVLQLVADHLDIVVAAGLGFAAWKFIPGLIDAIAVSSIRLAAVFGASLTAQGGLSAGFATASAAVGSLGTAGVTLIPVLGTIATEALTSAAGTQTATERAAELRQEFDDGKISAGQAAAAMRGVVPPAKAVAEGLGDAANANDHLGKSAITGANALQAQADATDALVESMREQYDATLALADSTFGLIEATRDNRTAEHELAAAHHRVNELVREGKTDTKAYAEAKRDLRDKALDAAESEAALAAAVRKLQQDIADGKTSRAEAVDSIKALGKEAGLTGHDIQGLVNDIKSGLHDAASTAERLAPGIGRSISEGISGGIDDAAGAIAVSAERAVLRAMAAAREAAKAKSPSQVMKDLGLDMMEGLYVGITKGAQKVIDGARKEIQKLVDQIGSELDKVKGKAQSFADSIRSGFSGFLDISGAFSAAGEGADLSSVLSAQVGGATALANVLEALKRQGASKATLSQVAGAGVEFGQTLLQGGPDLITEMNNSLKTISELANQTGKGLSESFFGEKIDRLEKRLERQNELLHDLVEIERLGHDHAIILDGVKVTETIRNQLVKVGNRNPDIFGGRA